MQVSLKRITSKFNHLGHLLHHQAATGLAVTAGMMGTVMVINSLGWLQLLEFQAFDWFTRHQPSAELDERIAVVTIAEEDISALGRWPIADETLAELLEKLNGYEPRVVGLDLYRDVPVPPGEARLAAAYQAMPMLLGVEKAVGDNVSPSPLLDQLGQVALADLVLDADDRVRRGLISIRKEGKEGKEVKLGLAAYLALIYLQSEGIEPEWVEGDSEQIRLGLATFEPLQSRSGSYQGLDTGGYQILMNYRGGSGTDSYGFSTYSVTDVLDGRLPEGALKDRLVLVGVKAPSLNDTFLTPYDSSFAKHQPKMAGVFVHAHLTRQILTAALEGEGGLSYWAEPWEYGWIGGWAIAAAAVSWRFLQSDGLRKRIPPGWLVVGGATGLSGGIVLSGYGLFSLGWWVPVGAPLTAVVMMSVAMVAHHNQVLEQLALVDELTQVANRRQFDRSLRQKIQQPHVSLILCDIDYFKPYNDTYGHQAGDECLAKVARAIRQAVRHSDIVARYGGEEFAVILPNTRAELAAEIGERVRAQVQSLKLEHESSQVSDWVTLSCGVTAVEDSSWTPHEAVLLADKALYLAKSQGRNRVVLQEDEQGWIADAEAA